MSDVPILSAEERAALAAWWGDDSVIPDRIPERAVRTVRRLLDTCAALEAEIARLEAAT